MLHNETLYIPHVITGMSLSLNTFVEGSMVRTMFSGPWETRDDSFYKGD